MFFNMMRLLPAFLDHIRPVFVWRGRFSGRKFQKTVYPDVLRAQKRERRLARNGTMMCPPPRFVWHFKSGGDFAFLIGCMFY